MKNHDLQGIIRAMASRLDMHQSAEAGAPSGTLSEVEAYMAVDPTLASLYKEFMDARRNRRRALEQQGSGSAMADIARDLEESAQSAMETRMIELRENTMKRMMAERMMAHAHIAEMNECRSESAKWYAERQAQNFAEQKRDEAVMARHQHEGQDSFMMLTMMWWMMRQMAWRTQIKLSLASSFSRALNHDHYYATSTA